MNSISQQPGYQFQMRRNASGHPGQPQKKLSRLSRKSFTARPILSISADKILPLPLYIIRPERPLPRGPFSHSRLIKYLLLLHIVSQAV